MQTKTLQSFCCILLELNENNDNHDLSESEKRALDVVKVMYNYSRSRYAKLHKVKEFKIIFTYIYTQNMIDSDKSCLESIFESETKIIAKDKVNFAVAFNLLYERLTEGDNT